MSTATALLMFIATFIVIVVTLAAILIGSTVVQRRRYLRTRQHLGARLLTAQDEERAAIARDLNTRGVSTKMGAQRLLLRCSAGAAGAANAGKGWVIEKESKGKWQVGNVEHVLTNATVKVTFRPVEMKK